MTEYFLFLRSTYSSSHGDQSLLGALDLHLGGDWLRWCGGNNTTLGYVAAVVRGNLITLL